MLHSLVLLHLGSPYVNQNTGLSISLNRYLSLANTPADENPLQINDTVITVPFRGPKYIIPPGVKGVASLVFDVPKVPKVLGAGCSSVMKTKLSVIRRVKDLERL